MKFRSTALAILCSAGLAACQGASTYAPHLGDSSPATTNGSRSIDADAPACTAKPATLPGKYVGLFASGTVTGKTYTSVFGQWSLVSYKKGAAPDATAHEATPQAAPTPSWIYAGTYTMKKTKQKGCVLIVVGEQVSPEANTASSTGLLFAAPVPPVKKYHVVITELGIASIKITGLSAKGGQGTATLLTTQFKPYDTATIVLGNRTSISNP